MINININNKIFIKNLCLIKKSIFNNKINNLLKNVYIIKKNLNLIEKKCCH